MHRLRTAVALAGLTAGLVAGQGPSPTPTCAEVTVQTDISRAKIDPLFKQLGNLSFGLGATGIVQGTVNNGNNNPDKGNTTDANWSLDFEIGAPIGPSGQAFVLIEAGQGNGLTDEPGVGDSLFGLNNDAGDSEAHLEVIEVWYEHRLWKERVWFTIGKIDLTNYFDANVVANDETSAASKLKIRISFMAFIL